MSKGALSSLRQFLATKSPIKMMKNAFCFTVKIIFDLEIFRLFFWILSHVGKLLQQRAKTNFKLYDVTNWIKSNHNTHIVR